MKALLILLLTTMNAVGGAAELDTVVAVDQKPISKSLDFDSGPDAQVSASLFDNRSVFEITFSSGLRIEVDDLVGVSDENLIQPQEPQRVYGFIWQPGNNLIGVGLETEVEERNGRKVLKTRPSLRASKNFEGHNWEGSIFLKPLWDHRESSAGLKVGIRIDF